MYLYFDFFSKIQKTVTLVQSAASPTAELGDVSSILAGSHTFVVEIEMISMVIFLLLIQAGLLSVITSEIYVMCTKYWLIAKSSLPRKKVWLDELCVSK